MIWNSSFVSLGNGIYYNCLLFYYPPYGLSSPKKCITNGITKSMKTAISVEDALMEEADSAARTLGLSRSALVAEALRDYLLRLRQAKVTEQLNQAYANDQSAEERQLVQRLRKKIPSFERW